MATTEDFSFPITTDNPPCFIESPPLWHRSCSTPSGRELLIEPAEIKTAPKGDDVDDHHKEAEESFSTESKPKRKSFSWVERKWELRKEGSEAEEEKMDMLWEDFNEEIVTSESSSSSNCLSSGLEYPSGRVVYFGCGGQGLKLSKTGKKPRVVEFIKVLKKLFLLHNSQRSLKKSTW